MKLEKLCMMKQLSKMLVLLVGLVGVLYMIAWISNISLDILTFFAAGACILLGISDSHSERMIHLDLHYLHLGSKKESEDTGSSRCEHKLSFESMMILAGILLLVISYYVK